MSLKWFTEHIDGWLYVGIAVCPAIVAALSVTEATQFLPPVVVFYIKGLSTITGVALTAGKAYRSTAYGTPKPDKTVTMTETVSTTETPKV